MLYEVITYHDGWDDAAGQGEKGVRRHIECDKISVAAGFHQAAAEKSCRLPVGKRHGEQPGDAQGDGPELV